MTSRVRGLLLGALLLPCLSIAGCNIIGPAYLLVHGPEKTPEAYKLNKDRPTVVFVDDRANILARRTLRQRIAEGVQKELLKQGALKNVIDTTAAIAVASREPSGQPMEITSIGQAVKAEVVIYVTVDSFALSTDGHTYEPTGVFHVKVLDVNKPDAPRLWPEEKEGKAVTALIRTKSAAAPTTLSERVTMLDALAEKSGLVIAQLFYEHEASERLDQTK